MSLPLELGSVIPVLIIDRVEDGVDAAAAVIDGGLATLEITLRTPHALDALEAIAARFRDALIGAGMVMRPADVTAARNAGAQFLTSPGLTPSLAAAGIASGLAFVPGAATPTEVMAARELSFSYLKFFPAREAGGVIMLRAFAAAFPGIAFCAGGGIAEADAPTYLALPNVSAVNATWIATPEAIAARDWSGISARARRAAAMAAN